MRGAYDNRPQAPGPGPQGRPLRFVQRSEMEKITTFRDLVAWQKAMDLAEEVHRAVRTLAAEDRWTLGKQLVRASASVPSNIAEGFSRRSRPTYRRHVAIALGSQAEVQTQVELARRLELISDKASGRLLELADQVGRLLYGLWRSLAPIAVCYSWLLFLLSLGPGPVALGLTHGFSFFAQS